jgi:23S rRNA pseudouridine2605 synthase
LGDSVDPLSQRVSLDGKPLQPPRTQPLTLVLNKPRGVVTTMRDPQSRVHVADFLPRRPRMFPVGRLDAQTSGVLVCTSDGALAQLLTHPRYGVTKLYRAEVSGTVTAQAASALNARVVRQTGAQRCVLEIELHEGKNRQVRRMCARQGLRVEMLQRVRFGPVALGSLAPGRTRPLSAREHLALQRLRAQALQEIEKAARTGSAMHRQAQRPPR